MRFAAVMLVMAAALCAGAASGQDKAAMADALFDQARQAMAARDYDNACTKFREADRLDPQPGSKMNLGLCEEKRGKLATAASLYRAAIEALPASDERKALASKQLAAIAGKVPKLVLRAENAAPEDMRARIGDVDVGAAWGTPLPVDPGEVVVVVSAPGRQARQMRTQVAAGETVEMAIAPGPALATAPPADNQREATPDGRVPGGDAADPPQPSGSGTLTTVGWIIGASGLALAIAGAVTGGLGLGEKSSGEEQCDATKGVCSQEGVDANDAAQTLLTTTTVLWVVGGVAIATGITLLLLDDGDGASQTALVTHVSPFGATLTLQQRF